MILIATVKVRALKANTTKNVHSIMSTVFIKLRFMLLKRQKGGKNTSLLNAFARSTITRNLRHKRDLVHQVVYFPRPSVFLSAILPHCLVPVGLVQLPLNP